MTTGMGSCPESAYENRYTSNEWMITGRTSNEWIVIVGFKGEAGQG
jgi:hypothetical protein